MDCPEELERLEEAIEVSRSTIGEKELALGRLNGGPGTAEAVRLIELYRDVLGKQLVRRAELLA